MREEAEGGDAAKPGVALLFLIQNDDLVASGSIYFEMVTLRRYVGPIKTPEVRGRTERLACNTTNKNICWEYLDTAHVATNGHGRPC